MSAQFPEPINPDDLGRGPLVMGLNWTFTILCVLFVAARFWVRKKIAGFWGWDDWLMLASAVCLPHTRHLLCILTMMIDFPSRR